MYHTPVEDTITSVDEDKDATFERVCIEWGLQEIWNAGGLTQIQDQEVISTSCEYVSDWILEELKLQVGEEYPWTNEQIEILNKPGELNSFRSLFLLKI